MTYKQLQTNFERELLLHLVLGLRRERISNERSKKIASEFLKILRAETTVDGFRDKLSKISQFYPEIREAFLTTFEDYEKDLKNVRLQQASEYIKNGEIDLALKAARGGE